METGYSDKINILIMRTQPRVYIKVQLRFGFQRRDAMAIYLLDESLKVEVHYDHKDCGFDDNICVRISEDCPADEKLFVAEEINMFITIQQAKALSEALGAAVLQSRLGASGK
jgi:hypothetical protein